MKIQINCTTRFALLILFFVPIKFFPSLQLFCPINRFLNRIELIKIIKIYSLNYRLLSFPFSSIEYFSFPFFLLPRSSIRSSLLSHSFTDIRSSHPLPPLFSTPIHSHSFLPFVRSSSPPPSLFVTHVDRTAFLLNADNFIFSAIVESNKLTDDGIVGRWGMRGEL